MDDTWQRIAIAGAIVIAALILARLVDRAIIGHLNLPPKALTRYRVLRRSITAAIVAIGVLSALFVIPEFRAVAGALLASSAVIGLILGMAARSTLANYIAGINIAFTQPLRLGDEVRVEEAEGSVEEVGLTYTIIRTPGGARYYVPNEKLASDTIRNQTIGRTEHMVEVTVPVPLASDLDRVLAIAEDEARAAGHEETRTIARVKDFDTTGEPVAVITLETWAPAGQAAAVEADLRRAVHRRLRTEGVF